MQQLNRKDEILEALIAQFQETGFSTEFTMSGIANRIDIGKSTIYEYFKNKDDMMQQAILRLINNLVDDALNVEGIEEMNFEEALKTQFRYILDVADRSRMMVEVMNRGNVKVLPTNLREEIKAKMEHVRDLLEQRFVLIFLKGVQENVLTADVSPARTLVVSSIIVGSIFRYANTDHSVDRDDFIEEVYQTIVKISS